MRERISQLAKGIFEMKKAQVSLSASRIEDTVAVDDKIRGDFIVSGGEDRVLKGLVYSSNQKVKVLTPQFMGRENRIHFEVDTTQDTGDLTGEFQVVSDGGELFIPYLFHISAESREKLTVNTLADFMAMVDEEEELALRLFESSRFTRLPFMQDPGLYAIYEGIWGRGDRTSAMEEFLVAAGARGGVHFSLPQKEKEYPGLSEAICDDLMIHRSGPGYCRIRLEAEGDFIRLDKRELTDLDFDGNECAVLYTILPDKLHCGLNLGRIHIKGLYETETVTIRVLTKTNRTWPGSVEYKRDIIAFTKLYLKYGQNLGQNFSRNSVEKSLVLNSMQSILNHSREHGKDPSPVLLYQCDVSLRQGRTEQAAELLAMARDEVLKNRDKNVSLYCYYMWLKAKLSRDLTELSNMQKLVRKYYEEGTAQDMAFFILMQEDPELQINDSLILSRMKEHFRKGSRSPFLYMAGAKIFLAHPDLLRVLEPFEVHCLRYAARYGVISEALAKEMAALCLQVKKQPALCLWILQKTYEICPVNEVLTAICALLIRKDARDGAAFGWYEKGVEADVRLTRLYEYYLYAFPENYEKPLPKRLVLYFSMNHTLDYHAQAYLYENILAYYGQDEDVTRAYEGQIESFVVEQLFQGHVSEELAKIYEKVILPEMVDSRIAALLPKLLFAKKITCTVPGMRQAVICYEEMRGETVANLKNGVTYLPVYLENAHILFQDSYGNRYANLPYESHFIMKAPALEPCIRETEEVHRMIRMRECLEVLEKTEYSPEDIDLLKDFSQDEEIRPLFRKKLISRIVAYYYREEGLSASDGYLLTIDKKLLKREDRIKVMETLIAKDFFEEALRMAGRYGYRSISVAAVLKLTSRMILRRLYEEDPLLMELAVYCFEKKRYDGVVLEYLCQHYNGPCGRMYEVLSVGQEQGISLYDLPERLLAQMLFCGSFENLDEVFACYEKGTGIDEMLVHAYLAVKARLYFTSEEKNKEDLPAKLEMWLMNAKGDVPEICMLAQTRYYSELNGLTDEQSELCQRMIDRLLRKKIWFRYYRNLLRFISFPAEFLEDSIVEFYGGEGTYMVRMKLLPDGQEATEEVLPHMFGGYYAKRFSLLCGEQLRYEIYEYGKPELILASGIVAKEQMPYGRTGQSARTRVDMLNELLKLLEDGDEAAWEEKAMQYAVRDEMTESLFTALEEGYQDN